MKRLLLSLLLVLFSWTLYAAETTIAAAPAGPSPKGYVTLDEDYGIFPENRIGNSLYLKKKKIFTRQDLAIRDILNINDGLLYLGYDNQEEPQMGWFGPTGAEIKKLEGGFFSFKYGGKKKLLRINAKGKIQDLLPRSSTPGNLLFNGKDKAVFTHITAGETIEVEGKAKYIYTYKLHIVRNSAPKVQHLRGEYHSYDPKLNYLWIGPDELEVRFGEGEVRKLSIR